MECVLRIKTVIFASGEPFPMLMRAADNMPCFTPTVYLISMIRQAGRQAATLDQHARCIKWVYTWASSSGIGIDIDTRFAEGNFLSLPEI